MLRKMDSPILIVLSSLTAEGTPVLALEMVKLWKAKSINVRVATLADEPSDLRQEFQAQGVDVIGLSVRFGQSDKFISILEKTRRLCRRLHPQAVISFPFGWHSYVAWGAGLAGVRKVVAHAGNYPVAANRDSIRKLRLTVLFGEVWKPQVACCSDHVRAGLRQHLGLPAERLHTIYNGIDLTAFSLPPRRQPNDGGAVRLGMVARLEGHKDHPTLLHAIAALRGQGCPVELDIVGEGSRRGEITALIRQLNLGDAVRILGMRRDIPALATTWDLFAFSVNEDEGLGIALIEALAAGVPVIASDVGACREVLNGGVWGDLGSLFAAGQPNSLLDAVQQFQANREAWWRRADVARRAVQDRFTVDAMSKAYLRLAMVSCVGHQA